MDNGIWKPLNQEKKSIRIEFQIFQFSLTVSIEKR